MKVSSTAVIDGYLRDLNDPTRRQTVVLLATLLLGQELKDCDNPYRRNQLQNAIAIIQEIE